MQKVKEGLIHVQDSIHSVIIMFENIWKGAQQFMEISLHQDTLLDFMYYNVNTVLDIMCYNVDTVLDIMHYNVDTVLDIMCCNVDTVLDILCYNVANELVHGN